MSLSFAATARPVSKTLSRALACAVALILAGCNTPIKREASYPERVRGVEGPVYSDKGRETIWGEGKSLSEAIFGGEKDEPGAGASGLGVNSFLWRAALDTISFMPVASADPFGGVILTDWYENPDKPGERFKVNIYILDRQLRADGVRVSVFKQESGGKDWRDVTVATHMGTDIENAILTRARELRVAQMGSDAL